MPSRKTKGNLSNIFEETLKPHLQGNVKTNIHHNGHEGHNGHDGTAQNFPQTFKTKTKPTTPTATTMDTIVKI
jgi:hypothetical protein